MNQVDHAIEISPKLLNFFENYFEISTPLPKIDMVAVPVSEIEKFWIKSI